MQLQLRLQFVMIMICFMCKNKQVSSVDTLRQGESLNFTSQLVSSANIFTLGFYTPTPSDNNNSYIAIWYTDNSRNPVWIANRDLPVLYNSSATATLTINNNTGSLLITTNLSGVGENVIETLYDGGVTSAATNVYATLLDSGNFILRNSSDDVILWQSFDYPTDTLIPGMKLGINHATGKSWTLRSWFGPENPASGPFTLEWDTNADSLVIRRRGILYWTSGRMRDYNMELLINSTVLRVKAFEDIVPDPFNFNYNFTNVTNGSEEFFTYSIIQGPDFPDHRNVISGWRLDYQDGNIAATVGVNGVFTLVVVGQCYGYQLQGDDVGCQLWEKPTCRNPNQAFQLRSGYMRFRNGTRSSNVYEGNSSLSFSDCRTKCWNDCECAAFNQMDHNSGGCQYYRGESLEFEQSLDGSSSTLYLLVSNSSNRRRRWLISIILPITITVLLLSLCTALFLVRRSRKRKKKEEEMNELLTLEGYTDTYELENEGANAHDLRQFTYASILTATSNFSSKNKLGEGGFGPVYKGKTPEGHEIAVKLLSKSSGQGLLEFKTELVLISKLQHVNLVKLVGFCIHGDDKIIIYEYMPNKSLDFYLFDPSKREQLDWGRRLNIIEGIAQGLLYLHKYSRLSIVHRDLKSGNILLDNNLNPKISDFGLARIFKENTDEANTNRRVGTYGYMAPEYAMQGIFSYKSDVYSFGVLLLEIVSGRKNSSFRDIEGPLTLVEYAWELWNKDSALELMDPTLMSSCIIDQFHKCINIGLLCVENRAADRPTIENIISMLKNETSSLPLPKNPAFVTRNGVLEELAKSSSENLSPNEATTNEVTISEMRGR